MLLGALHGSVYYVKLGSNKSYRIGFWCDKVLCGTPISVERLKLGLYDVRLDSVFLEYGTIGTVETDLEGSSLKDSFVSTFF